ncbi:protachykinin-1 isoform 2-T4 [Menidia menidia]
MKLLLPLMLMLAAATQGETNPGGGGDPWTGGDPDHWTSSSQDGWLPGDPFREMLLRMTRKPRPHQFIGLMGRRSTANTAQITHKRHKINSFVGLMGKRSQEEPDSYEWRPLQASDRRR